MSGPSGTVMIAGAARNCGNALRDTHRRLEQAFAGFAARKWLVVESDSTDDTVEVLQDLAARNGNFNFVTLGELRTSIESRTERIAHCRNAYLKAFRTDEHFADAAILAVADLDGITDLLDHSAVESCFARDDWSVCTANQAGPYYDIYALRHDNWCPEDWWTQFNFARDLGISDPESTRFACHSKMLHIPADAPWIPVRSAFGGLALYRRSALLDPAANYAGSEDGVGLCEHVPLHRALTEAGETIFINPLLINAALTEHSADLFSRRQALHHLKALASISLFQAKKLFGRGV